MHQAAYTKLKQSMRRFHVTVSLGAGVIGEFKGKEKKREIFLKHQQTVDTHVRAPKVDGGLF